MAAWSADMTTVARPGYFYCASCDDTYPDAIYDAHAESHRLEAEERPARARGLSPTIALAVLSWLAGVAVGLALAQIT